MSEISNQKGALTPLAVAIIAIVIVGGIYLLNQKSSKGPTTNAKQETSQKIQEQVKEVIKDVPDPVNEFLNTFDIKRYEDAGMKVYRGNNPPNIEGSYKSSSLTVLFDSGNIADPGDQLYNYTYRFFDQKENGTISFAVKGEANDEGEGVGAFISGDDRCFTVYVDTKGKAYQCNIRQAELFSACKTDKGLEQYKEGIVMKKREGTGCDELMSVGDFKNKYGRGRFGRADRRVGLSRNSCPFVQSLSLMVV